MFAITADQIDSRIRPDHADEALAILAHVGGDRLALPADRTAGDEVQALTEDPRTALDIVLALARTGLWSIGVGIGDVRAPLPTATRAATGDALVAAREAVEAAKRRQWRLAVAGDRIAPAAETLQAMIELLLQLRERRSPEGWELYDLVEAGLTQAEAAERLGITPQAASKRALAAAVRLDAAARDGIVELLALANGTDAGREPGTEDNA
ncbi:DNA-binding protein [Protaetiibacter sp. SSC-01]|uniref:DNA-binding protein n=1 Tax=Protaetiibacter sp. SSC-01 TaxID=2759943 RepID=UPI0016574DBF|nr:DNA-binding protein [Protaetiibacter sp. SSC-01]QNO38879.1 DNA-binding protein [Protaetiibacter sp. SSC-01]